MLKAASLKSQDVVVACKISVLMEISESWTCAKLADELGLSTSTVHESFERCRLAQVLVRFKDGETISKRHFHDLLVIAVPRIFYAIRGRVIDGMPTSVYAEPIASKFLVDTRGTLPLIWEGSEGDRRGESIAPLYPTVPEAARKDARLYELLALVDVLRTADARNRNIAASILEKRILKGEGA